MAHLCMNDMILGSHSSLALLSLNIALKRLAMFFLVRCSETRSQTTIFAWSSPQPWNQIQNINIYVIIPSTLRLVLEFMQDCTINICIYLMMSDQLISQMCTSNCLSQMQLMVGLRCSFRQKWCFFIFMTKCHDMSWYIMI